MDKIDTAIKRLQAASEMALSRYKTPLVVTTSGGKDSSVCVELARLAGIPFEVQHNHTTADAPVWNVCAKIVNVWDCRNFRHNGTPYVPAIIGHVHFSDIKDGWEKEKADNARNKRAEYRLRRKERERAKPLQKVEFLTEEETK